MLCSFGFGRDQRLTALILVFADADGGFDVIPYCWLPGETLREREDEDSMPYRLWARDEYLLTFPGRSTDPKAVAMKVAELHGLCNIKALAYDRWRIEDFKRELDAIGCGMELVPFGQGFKDMAPAIDRVEQLVEAGKLRHDNHPVLWMAAANCRVEMDAAGNKKLSKRKSTGRIDHWSRLPWRSVWQRARAGRRYPHADCLTDGKVALYDPTLAAPTPVEAAGDPLCEYGSSRPGRGCHRRRSLVPIKRGGDRFHPRPLSSCCEAHHNEKTRAEQQGRELTPKLSKAAMCTAIRSIQIILVQSHIIE